MGQFCWRSIRPFCYRWRKCGLNPILFQTALFLTNRQNKVYYPKSIIAVVQLYKRLPKTRFVHSILGVIHIPRGKKGGTGEGGFMKWPWMTTRERVPEMTTWSRGQRYFALWCGFLMDSYWNGPSSQNGIEFQIENSFLDIIYSKKICIFLIFMIYS